MKDLFKNVNMDDIFVLEKNEIILKIINQNMINTIESNNYKIISGDFDKSF